MKILITGCKGQLGNEMREALAGREAEVIYTDVEELDITNMWNVEQFIEQNQVTHIVNCAAYTAVDKAEDDRIMAAKLNIDAVHNLAMAAAHHNVKLVHISTDYVFDGRSCQPYTENMPAMPGTVYGKTKFGGEQVLMSECRNAIIIRTAWLYSSYGNNFVKTMLRLGAEKDEISVVFDQVGSPTYAADLAKTIVHILFESEWIPGVYHFTNEGVCSWFDFAKMIFELSGIDCKVNAISSAEYKCRTPRPFYSVLNKKKIKETFRVEVPYWVDSLKECIQKLKDN